LQAIERRHLLAAWRTPCRPYVEQHSPPAEVCKRTHTRIRTITVSSQTRLPPNIAKPLIIPPPSHIDVFPFSKARAKSQKACKSI
jgi:hypothetical protein